MLYRCSLAVGGGQSVGMTDTVASARTALHIFVSTCSCKSMSAPCVGGLEESVADGSVFDIINNRRTRDGAVVETVMKQRCLVAQF